MNLPPEMPPYELARQRIRRRFAASLPQADFLAREVARRMAERLAYIRHTPTRVLDLGCGHGQDLALLKARYPQASCLACDFAVLPPLPPRSLWQKLSSSTAPYHALYAEASALPFARESLSMIWSNLMLHWLHDPMPTLREMHRTLNDGGLLMFTTLGPDTLKELRQALPGPHTQQFIDMHDLGDSLVKAGFAEPVMDMEILTLTYPDLDTLFTDLAASGNRNTRKDHAPLTRRALNQARDIYPRQADGQLPVSIEVIYGHAWRAPAKQLADGRSVINFKTRS